MERLGDMKIYSLEEAMDEDLGKSGTPERDASRLALRKK